MDKLEQPDAIDTDKTKWYWRMRYFGAYVFTSSCLTGAYISGGMSAEVYAMGLGGLFTALLTGGVAKRAVAR